MIGMLIRSLVYSWRYRGRRVTVKRTAHVSHTAELEGLNRVGHHTTFRGRLGLGSYIGKHCELAADIGRYSSIAHHVSSNPGIHTYKAPYATTSPLFFNRDHLNGPSFATHDVIDNLRYADRGRRLDVAIGNDCWICSNVFFAGGVRVADGGVVLAGAVVTRDVKPYEIVGGVPARTVGYRYDPDTIAFLQQLRWWDMPETWLRENWQLLNDLDGLKAAFPELTAPATAGS